MEENQRNRKKLPNPYTGRIVIIILVIIAVLAGKFLYDRYSFTKEKANLEEYLGVSGNEIAIYVNDKLEKEIIDDNKDKENQGSVTSGKYDTSKTPTGQSNQSQTGQIKGLYKNNACYLPLSWVKKRLNNRFYYAEDVKKVLYSLPQETKGFGPDNMQQVANAPYVELINEPYLLVDFVKEFTNIRFDSFLDSNYKRIYIYTDWDKETIGTLKSGENARWKGGNKSPIITECKKGEEVKILERMTKWSKVKTLNGYVGYIRNTKIGIETISIPRSNYREQVRESYGIKDKVCLGFHQLFSIYSSSRLPDILKDTVGMNVIAPTWYVIKNDEGEIRSLANPEYTVACHKKGLKVWATLNNFDIEDVNEKKIFGNSATRKKMIDKLMREVEINYLDGINLDIESLPTSAGEDYTQFVRELSIACKEKKITLSIDVYVPYSYNRHYNLEEFNFFCDYVFIMAYDEHYKGSDKAGSVSSLPFVKDGIELTLSKVDRSKLVIALPFYTRIWTTSPEGKITSSVLDANTAYQRAINQGLRFEYDEATGQNYGSKTSQAGDFIECWSEDEKSLGNKMELIKKENLAGTAAWKLSQQKETFFDIINMNR